MKTYKAAPKAIRTARAFVAAIAIINLLIIEYIFVDRVTPPLTFAIILLHVGITVFVWKYYLVQYFENYSIILSETTILKRCGFFFIKENSVPLDAIQYTTSVTSVFMNKIGLKGFNIIIVYAYGGTLFIPFLSSEETAKIKHDIDHYIKIKSEKSGAEQ